jgi:hypothetical protein
MSYERGLSRKNFSLAPAAIPFSLQPAPWLIVWRYSSYMCAASQLLFTDSSRWQRIQCRDCSVIFVIETLFAHAELQQPNDPRLQAAFAVGH